MKSLELEQAGIGMEANPNLLDQNEFYQVAFTNKRGTPKFVGAFEAALDQNPESPVANLNVAGAYLSKKDIRQAERALAKADKGTPEYLNNLGVLSFYQVNYHLALARFHIDAPVGTKDANKNLKCWRNAVTRID